MAAEFSFAERFKGHSSYLLNSEPEQNKLKQQPGRGRQVQGETIKLQWCKSLTQRLGMLWTFLWGRLEFSPYRENSKASSREEGRGALKIRN